eukprot:271402_1
MTSRIYITFDDTHNKEIWKCKDSCHSFGACPVALLALVWSLLLLHQLFSACHISSCCCSFDGTARLILFLLLQLLWCFFLFPDCALISLMHSFHLDSRIDVLDLDCIDCIDCISACNDTIDDGCVIGSG